MSDFSEATARKMLEAAYEVFSTLDAGDKSEQEIARATLSAMSITQKLCSSEEQRHNKDRSDDDHEYVNADEEYIVASAFYCWSSGADPDETDPESVGGVQMLAFAKAVAAAYLANEASMLLYEDHSMFACSGAADALSMMTPKPKDAAIQTPDRQE